MDKPVIIFGAGPVGKAAYDIFMSHNVVIYGFLDDDKALHNTEIGEVAVLGSTTDDGFLKLIGQKAEAFVATDDNSLRKTQVEMLNKRRHVMPVNALHSNAMLQATTQLGHGNFVYAGAVLGSFVQLGNHCLVHAGAVVDSEAQLGDYVQVGARSVVGAGAKIADEVFIGSGVTIVPGVEVGEGARIGAGAVVISNVEEGDTVFGNPAKSIE